MRVNGRTLRPSTMAERRLLISLGTTALGLRVPRNMNPFTVARRLRRAAKGVTPDHDFARDLAAKMKKNPADLPVPWAGVKFDESGQNVGVRAIIMQLQGGKYWTVWPFEMATRDVIFPIPTWSERK